MIGTILTPKLVGIYQELLKAGKPMEVIFVSADSDEKEFAEFHKTMPWPALAFSERALKTKLESALEAASVPTLILFDENSGLITKKGKEAVFVGGAALASGFLQ